MTIYIVYGVKINSVKRLNSLLDAFLKIASPEDIKEIDTNWNLVDRKFFPDDNIEMSPTIEWLTEKLGLPYSFFQIVYILLKKESCDDLFEIPKPTKEQKTKLRNVLGKKLAKKAKVYIYSYH